VSDEPEEPKWWAAHAGDPAVRSLRERLLSKTSELLRSLADTRIKTRTSEAGTFRSIVLRVAQYWNDQADDECHVKMIASDDAEPFGLHGCGWDDQPSTGDPACEWCANGMKRSYELFGHLYGPLIPAVEAFCAEANQNMDDDAAYRPWATVRLEPSGEVATRIVGVLVRPWLDMPTDRAAYLPVDDRVLALAGDRDARDVLVDALIEAGDPRGEALAHGTLDDELARTWLGALDPIVPRSGLELDRGVPSAIGLYLDASYFDSDERLPLAFRPAVRFLPGSRKAIWPALAAARALGPLDAEALLALATSPVPFRAAELELEVSNADELSDLVDTLDAARPNLPELRAVRFIGYGVSRHNADTLARSELAGLALEVTSPLDNLDEHLADVPAWRAIGATVSMYDADAHRASGWIVPPTGHPYRRGYHRRADAERGARLLGVLR
jgi:hypothetical protein